MRPESNRLVWEASTAHAEAAPRIGAARESNVSKPRANDNAHSFPFSIGLAVSACLAAVALLSPVAGCADASFAAPDPAALASLDEATYRCAVEPTLVQACSYLGCHGREAMPFRVYAPGALRAMGGQTSAGRAAPLIEPEHHANFLSALGQSFHTSAANNQLVLKGLPAASGGYAHVGGAIWSGRDDPRVQRLLDWLNGASAGCAGAEVVP